MEEIGEGGYGKVYKAKWMSNPVAVKTYLKAGRIHRESLDDFLKEVEILNNLRHPNVVLYMGMCIQISRYSLVTEYLEEGSLYDQLHKKHTKLST
jgi:serine/threonine protein kinase